MLYELQLHSLIRRFPLRIIAQYLYYDRSVSFNADIPIY